LGGSITDGEGIILDTNTNYVGVIEVENNTAYGNGGPGIEDFLTNNAVINGNTAYGNATTPGLSGEGQIFINQSTGSTVTNNTMTEPGSGSTITLSSADTNPIIDQSNVTIVGAGSFSLFIGGTEDIAILSGGNETVQANEGYNTIIITGGGRDTIDISGSGNVVNASGTLNNIHDTGTDNTIVLQPAAQGLDRIYGNVLQNGDTIDLQPLLASTSWNGSQNTLADFLRVGTEGTNAVLQARATPRSSYSADALFTGSGGLTLSQILTHALT
jgi:hypothetical protein